VVDTQGEFSDGEEPLAAAKREFEEEMAFRLPVIHAAGVLKQPNGKLVFAWAVRSDFDPSRLKATCFYGMASEVRTATGVSGGR